MSELIQWFGSHPLEGSKSMEVYRESLLAEIAGDDRYQIGCWPEQGTAIATGGRVRKAMANYAGFPLRVRNENQASLVHFLDHSSSHLLKQVGKGTAKVVTLHDLIPIRFPGGLSEAQVKRFKDKVSLMRDCDCVISVSEYSKSEAIELLGLDKDLIEVVPNGVSRPSSVPGSSEGVSRLRKRGTAKIVLSVGSTMKRKNLGLLPGIFKELGAQSSEQVALLRVGPDLDNSLRSELESVLGKENILEAGRLSNLELWAAYEHSDAVIVPSLYEGFGLPVMEAFACGTAVACSSATSLPEVGGDLAAYFHPEDAKEGADALYRCLFDSSVVNLSAERKARAAEFTWRKHLEGFYRVYDRILNTK